MKNANGVIKKLTSAERSYYTAAEVREMMGVSRDTAYRMIRSLRSDLIAKPYSQTYLKTLHNQLSAIFNHAVRYYELRSNPAAKVGNMGS